MRIGLMGKRRNFFRPCKKRSRIGRGYLASSWQSRPANLMEYCFRDWLVGQLTDAAARPPLNFLADTWNLLEGLLREPRWVNAYVMARAWELEDEASLHAFLVRV